MDNYQLVTKGFTILREMLAPFVAAELSIKFKDNWWKAGVLNVLRDDQSRDLPSEGDWAVLVDSLDIARCLILIDVLWNEVFKKKLSLDHRNWVKELITTRNKWAHKGGGDFSSEDAWRALDTMARLLEHIDNESTEEIRGLVREVRYGTKEASTAVTKSQTSPAAEVKAPGVLNTAPLQGLLPWRFVIEPHPDVARGHYLQAEFAADLFQVYKGTAQIEYQDATEFFGRTYVTEGMKGLLHQAIKRVSGLGGEPVIQLKTSFGGGKTHSMLALYHLLRGPSKLVKIPHVKNVIDEAGIDILPKAKVAVLVGTALNPSKIRRPANFPGITIRTIWGEMAAQLAEQAGNPKLYDIVRDADKASVPPGSEALMELFDSSGQCVILIDELVAYARVLYGTSNLPAGTFDALLTFVQQLTEAVRASNDSIVVASIPESNIEIGGEAGQKALASIEHTFGRMESIWKPVGADEGFEIVRRRLFLPVQDKQKRDDACRAFSEMYRQNFQDFPAECKELTYFERLKSCYPIHPEVFERLYSDWATLERFQKTRGVLRLMAAVIHDLWVKNDHSLLIMPGSTPLDNINVREELTRYLSEGWNSVIEKEIDGIRSIPHRLDRENPRFTKYIASGRVSRAIFLGSAPSVREQTVRGLEDVRLRLGVVQPGEPVSVFNDSLSRLIDSLSYLYNNNRRYWYDLRPNLKRTVEDRAQQIPADDVEVEIEGRLKAFRDRADFAAVHNCPYSSLDIPDEQSVRLAVLPPKKTYKQKNRSSKAEDFIQEIIAKRGTSGRLYKNMLVFVAPDDDIIVSLNSEVRKFLAWKSVVEDIETLNLDALQTKQAKESLKRSSETVDLRVRETYCWLFVPCQTGTDPISLEVFRISGGTENHIVKASGKLIRDEQLITGWAPSLLLMQLDRWLWKNEPHIQIKKVWDYMSSYCYLPRLKKIDILLDAIKKGLASDEYFAYAEGVADSGRYLELKIKNAYVNVVSSGYLVKLDAAKKQIDSDREKEEKKSAITYPERESDPDRLKIKNSSAGEEVYTDISGSVMPYFLPEPPAEPPGPERFFGNIKLNTVRIGKDAGQIAEEVVQHLQSLPDAEIEVTLEIQATVPGGVPEDIVRVIRENCRNLKFMSYEFED
ncbi:MAG TPA: Swt1 family HEPN domain-containing protein [Candidatus Eremiobacteraeota bacterium]|nr:MAG: hypothetical protein BWY64_00439 [bacterium ADurb.Bin363]HPZ08328.1 Swt1 family HEPN domain-containing protein [Candidatus Eremiobacteraeota bacterium]